MHLVADLWAIVGAHIANIWDKYTLFALCREGREAVTRGLAQKFGFNTKQLQGFLDVVMCGRSMFLTGGAGVGKSYVVHHIADAIARAQPPGGTNQSLAVAIAAPTGAAARVASTSLVTGKTLHMLFNIRNHVRESNSIPFIVENTGGDIAEAEQLAVELGQEDELEEEAGRLGGLPTAVLDRPTRERLAALKLLIVDECSMITNEIMGLIDTSMRQACNINRPFGGCCVLFVGDFYQLRPVVTTRAAYDHMGGRIWAFQSPSWRTLQPLELTEVRRQSGEFPLVLNRIRVGTHTPADIRWINTHMRSAAQEAQITIFNSNAKCNELNARTLARLPGEEVHLEAERYCIEMVSYNPFESNRLEDYELPRVPTFPTGGFLDPLALKVGARVRCVKNTYDGRYPNRDLVVANGQLGYVTHIDIGKVSVKWDPLGDEEAEVKIMKPAYWTRKQTFLSADGYNIVAVVRQLPLKLASAITIHASQGSTFRFPMDIDPYARCTRTPGGDVWGPMPAGNYVSLSRATTAGNIRLLRPLRADFIAVDPEVHAYYQRTFSQP